MSRAKKVIPQIPLEETINHLIVLQRQRSIVIKSKIMQENRIVAIVAGSMGYSAFAEEKERDKKFEEARSLIKRVIEGEATHLLEKVIRTTYLGIDEFNKCKDDSTKQIEETVESLPIKGWIDKVEQRGFGYLSCGMILGETGDLSNYANPAKLWRRMGCAPYEKGGYGSGGKVAMGGTWKRGKEGKLTAEEWVDYGYSPRRRSIMYVITDCLLKNNGEGPYREKYIEAKIGAYEKHKDDPNWTWTKCTLCKGKPDGCMRCGDTGHKSGRAHLHSMLVAGKLLLYNLWCQWNPDKVLDEKERKKLYLKQIEERKKEVVVGDEPVKKDEEPRKVKEVAGRSFYT